MGAPRLVAAEIPTLVVPTTADGGVLNAQLSVGYDVVEVTCVSMGNPHAVIFVDNLSSIDL